MKRHRLERVPVESARPLAPFVLADGSGPAVQQTTVRIAHDRTTLFVRFECIDRDIWGTLERRDDPLWKEEVVEIFLAPGEADPIRYYEFEVSPRGVLFDARVENRGAGKADRTLDVAWDCPGIEWRAQADEGLGGWRAALSIPWASVTSDGRLPSVWRANFYRIERPRDGTTEYSCWCPTLTSPADFHRPERFGVLELDS